MLRGSRGSARPSAGASPCRARDTVGTVRPNGASVNGLDILSTSGAGPVRSLLDDTAGARHAGRAPGAAPADVVQAAEEGPSWA